MSKKITVKPPSGECFLYADLFTWRKHAPSAHIQSNGPGGVVTLSVKNDEADKLKDYFHEQKLKFTEEK